MAERLKYAGLTEQLSVVFIKVFAALGASVVPVHTGNGTSTFCFGNPLAVSMREVYVRRVYAIEIFIKPELAIFALVMINGTSFRARSGSAFDPV
jgi:hypothetical protein